MTQFNIYFFDTLNSTNEKLKELLSDGEIPEFSVVVTNFQTAGKGQEGNSWESERGKNLTASILLKPVFLPPDRQFYISKIVSLALADTIRSFDIKAEIKWPNDIYAGDSKIAGILIENSIMGAGISESIAGIGLNVNQEIFLSDARNPVSMKNIKGREFDVDEVSGVLLKNLKKYYDLLKSGGEKEIDERYFSLLYRREGIFRFKDPKGEFSASIEDIEPMGFLILKDTRGQKRRYAFKEVEFL
jgi:BirA family biotin operon repressor/biotin-[acetyl-CoA-carboxylase] ligase